MSRTETASWAQPGQRRPRRLFSGPSTESRAWRPIHLRPTGVALRRRATVASARPSPAVRGMSAVALRHPVKARNKPMSPAGNASGSRSSRIAMYCAVHSPMPGSARSCVTHSVRLRPAPRTCGSAMTAAASDASVAARALGMPSVVRSADARRSGTGKHMRQPPSSRPVPPSGRPWRATSFPARPTAAATVICWPSTARTASSNPSHAPGTRRPGRAATRGARMGSSASCALIA